MRKKRAFIIVLSACLFCACTKTSVISGSHQSVHHEFGESVHEKEYEDTYVMNLIYPKTNIKDVDERRLKAISVILLHNNLILKQTERN